MKHAFLTFMVSLFIVTLAEAQKRSEVTGN